VETPNRYLAGITEVALKEFVADKTNWRTMLTNKVEDVDLLRFRESMLPHIPEEAKQYILNVNEETAIHFPVLNYPEKVKSVNLTKTPEHSGVLKGIKGQYLIFEDGHVMNVRSHEGFVVEWRVG